MVSTKNSRYIYTEAEEMSGSIFSGITLSPRVMEGQIFWSTHHHVGELLHVENEGMDRFQDGPRWSLIPGLHTFYNPFYPHVGRTCDLLLNRTEHTTSTIVLQKTVISALPTDSFLLTLMMEAAILWANLWRDRNGKELGMPPADRWQQSSESSNP